MTTEDRFWTKVLVVESCWEWIGARSRPGYGLFAANGKSRFAHRYAYQLLRGPIPIGLELDHLCRNKGCVNPDHLEPVPHKENVLRGLAPSARWAKSDRCLKGHLFTEDNTVIRGDGGGRRCRACQREYKEAHERLEAGK